MKNLTGNEMIDGLLFALTLMTTLGSGLIAGVFFAFSSFVMKALARLPSTQGIAAMQSINVVVINRWFLGAFVGTAAACVLLVVVSLTMWHATSAAYLLIGGALYLVGTFLVTIGFNVPRNDALAIVKSNDVNAESIWARYVSSWTTWNHVRTVAALAAAASLTIALFH